MKLFNTIIFVSILLFLTSCSGSNNELRNRLKEVIIDKSNSAIKDKKNYSNFYLSEITDFDWDKFYIFEEYLTNRDINNITGIKWSGDDVPSGRRRILFIYKDEIVQYVDFEVGVFPVFFYPCEKTEQFVFGKKDDLFAVFKRCDKNGCRYAMVPRRCVNAYFENTKE